MKNTETPRTEYPRYVRIRQALLDWRPSNAAPETLAELITFAEELDMMRHVHLEDEQPVLVQGSGIYRVTADGRLEYVHGKWNEEY